MTHICQYPGENRIGCHAQCVSCPEVEIPELTVQRYRSRVRVSWRFRFKTWRLQRKLTVEQKVLLQQFNDSIERRMLFGDDV